MTKETDIDLFSPVSEICFNDGVDISTNCDRKYFRLTYARVSICRFDAVLLDFLPYALGRSLPL